MYFINIQYIPNIKTYTKLHDENIRFAEFSLNLTIFMMIYNILIIK